MRFLRSKDTTRTVDWDTYQRVLTERDTARKDAETWRTNFQTVNRRLAGEQAANERLDGRNRRLTEQLEQARDTVLPEVTIEKRFKPFVEDRLPALAAGSLGLIGHPGPWPACPRAVEQAVTLAIGPEGGWIPYEVEKLREAGLAPVQLGERILRVETAVTALLARLF